MDLFLKANWAGGVKETFEFLTTIFTSQSGKEQRSAERINARRTVSFQTYLHGQNLSAVRDYLHTRQHFPAFFPEPVRTIGRVATFAPAGSTTVVLGTAPAEALEDRRICIGSWQGHTFTTVAGVSGATLSLAEPLQEAVMVGDEVKVCFPARMPTSVSLTYSTDGIASLDGSFIQEPGFQNRDYGTDPFDVFRGREVMNEQPNWAATPNVEFATDYETTDFRRGVVRSFSPVGFFSKITQFTFLGRDTVKMHRLVDFFHRHLGRCEEFWCPSWTSDLTLIGSIINGESAIIVDGSNIASTYEDSTVEKAVAIKLADGSWLYRYITAMSVIGETTELTFDEPFTFDVAHGSVVGLYWLNVCRFAADTMTVQWITDEIAQTVLQIKTLESLPAEV